MELSRAGVEFASHSESHPRLTSLSDAALRTDLCRSRERLERMIRQPVKALVYPYGDVDTRVEAAAHQAGYELACSNESGNRQSWAHRFRLKRIPMDEGVSVEGLQRKLSLLFDLHCDLRRLVDRAVGRPRDRDKA